MANRGHKGHDQPWQSWGEVIEFLDGLCFGIAPDGRTVCLGKEALEANLKDKIKLLEE